MKRKAVIYVAKPKNSVSILASYYMALLSHITLSEYNNYYTHYTISERSKNYMAITKDILMIETTPNVDCATLNNGSRHTPSPRPDPPRVWITTLWVV